MPRLTKFLPLIFEIKCVTTIPCTFIQDTTVMYSLLTHYLLMNKKAFHTLKSTHTVLSHMMQAFSVTINIIMNFTAGIPFILISLSNC